MAFSRSAPSPRYRELVRMYETMHESGAPDEGIAAEDMFSGVSLGVHLADIRALVGRTGARTLLDYGSGKGRLYEARDFDLKGERLSSVADYLGVDSIRCFDPGVPAFATYPSQTFDGVICTDVLEHIPMEDIPWTLDEIFALADKFVFANIASYPAVKILPNGENAHVTQRGPDWWREALEAVHKRRAHVRYKIIVAEWDEDSSPAFKIMNEPEPPVKRRYKYTNLDAG